MHPQGHNSTPAYSIVIPVYNSADVVRDTVAATTKVFDALGDPYEIILVNDGSTDKSWEVIADIASIESRITSINLLKNYGQHTAVFCGLRESRGDYVLTIDDDMQNPPEELPRLIEACANGHDLVIGQFEQKRHSLVRRIGTRVVAWINKRVFGNPNDVVLTNVRCIRRDVVNRIVTYKGMQPYVTGLSLMYASNPANVTVEHRDRAIGTSNYRLRSIASLVFRILFNYSAWPLRFVSNVGIVIAAAALVFGSYTLIRALLGGTTIPGWASFVVMLSFFNGVSLLILSMLGEYVIRVANNQGQPAPYLVQQTIR